MTLDSNIILACWLGRFDYFDAMNLQNLLHSNILNRKSNYTILFLEHNEVLTLGSTERISSNAFKDLKEMYQKKGYMVAKSSRGGQVTLHNPGQKIIYFVKIFDNIPNIFRFCFYCNGFFNFLSSWAMRKSIC